jgi:hypothetical protein
VNETPVSGSGPTLDADAFNLFSEAVAYDLPNGSTTYVDREEEGTRYGPDRYHRLHIYISRTAGAGAGRWLADTSAELARDPVVRQR